MIPAETPPGASRSTAEAAEVLPRRAQPSVPPALRQPGWSRVWPRGPLRTPQPLPTSFWVVPVTERRAEPSRAAGKAPACFQGWLPAVHVQEGTGGGEQSSSASEKREQEVYRLFPSLPKIDGHPSAQRGTEHGCCRSVDPAAACYLLKCHFPAHRYTHFSLNASSTSWSCFAAQEGAASRDPTAAARRDSHGEG